MQRPVNIVVKDLEKDDPRRGIPELYSYITVRRENFGGYLFNPYLLTEVPLARLEMRVIELANGFFSIQEMTRIVAEEFGFSDADASTAVFSVLENLGRYYALKWRKRRKKGASERERTLRVEKITEPIRDVAREEDFFAAPLSVIWDLTYRCNLRCRHCLVDTTSRIQNELSLEEIRSIMNQIAEMKIFSIMFSGGEPLLRSDFFEILRYASQLNIGIKFSTNGLLVTDQVMKRLDPINVFAVQISIDGIGETHDTFRGGSGSFQKAVEALGKFVEAGYWTIVSTMMTKYNLSQIKSVLELAISLGAATFKLSAFIPTGRGRENIAELCLSPSETRGLALEVAKLKEKHQHSIQMETGATFPWLLQKSTRDSNAAGRGPRRVGCSAGRSQLVISPDGKVFPCPFLRDFVAGDLRKERLEDIWKGAEVFGMFRNLKQGHLKGKCSTCEHVPDNCQGGCRAAAYVRTEDFYAEDPLCWVS